MRVERGAALLVIGSVLSLGCAGLLGLDDRKFGEGGGGQGAAESGGGGAGAEGGAGGAGAGGAGTGGAACDNGSKTALVDDTFDFVPCGEPVQALTDRGWTYSRATAPLGGEQYPAGAPYPGVLLDGERLVLELAKTFFWSAGNKGALVYKEIAGDFLVVADVSLANKKDGGLPADAQAGVGLLVRRPDGKLSPFNDQTWIAYHLGADSSSGTPTPVLLGSWSAPNGTPGENDVSLTGNPAASAVPAPAGKIAICRKAGQYSLWFEDGAGAWSDRTQDLPPNPPVASLTGPVQVGLFAYSYNTMPDSPKGVVATFERVHQFDPSAKGCDPTPHLAGP